MREMREKDRDLHTVSQQPHADFSLHNSWLSIQDENIDVSTRCGEQGRTHIREGWKEEDLV